MNKKEKTFTLIVLVIAFVMVGGMLLYKQLNKPVVDNNTYGQIIYGHNVVMKEFNINEDAVYKFRGDYGTFEVEVKDGKFRMINVECPNHNCEDFGWQPDEVFYMPIICIPNNIEVILKED